MTSWLRNCWTVTREAGQRLRDLPVHSPPAASGLSTLTWLSAHIWPICVRGAMLLEPTLRRTDRRSDSLLKQWKIGAVTMSEHAARCIDMHTDMSAPGRDVCLYGVSLVSGVRWARLTRPGWRSGSRSLRLRRCARPT